MFPSRVVYKSTPLSKGEKEQLFRKLHKQKMEADELYTGFKLVNLKGSPSYQTNNLSTNGEYFVYAKNSDPMSKLYLFHKM